MELRLNVHMPSRLSFVYSELAQYNATIVCYTAE